MLTRNSILSHDPQTDVRAGRKRSWRLVQLALISTLLGGSLLGALNLVSIHIFYIRNIPLVQAHAFLQLFGFVLPIAMGMALRLMPPATIQNIASKENRVFLFVLIGVPIYLLGYVWALQLKLIGMLFVIGGVGHFLALLLSGLKRWKSDLPPPAILTYCAAGFLAASLISTLMSLKPEITYTSFLYGFTLSLISSVVINMAPGLTGAPPMPMWVRRTTLLIPVGVILQLGTVENFGTLLWSLGAVVLALAVLRTGGIPRDLTASRRVRVCFAWLLVSALARGGLIASHEPPHTFVIDAARHIYTVGFLMQLLFIMLSYLATAFEHRGLENRNLFRTGLVLLNASLLLRMFEIVAAYSGTWALYVSGISGVLSWFATFFLVIPIWRTISKVIV